MSRPLSVQSPTGAGGDGGPPGRQWSELAKDAWRRGEAATDPREARRWLERARRMAPHDDTVALSLALACLRGDDAAGAQALFAPLAARLDLSEAWLGLAASALRQRDMEAALSAMQAALSGHTASAAARLLAAAIALAAGLPGWCALDSLGRLHTDGPADIAVDGRVVPLRRTGGRYRLSPGRVVAVHRAGMPLLGSPIQRHAIDRVEGIAAADDRHVAGWAWYPRNPDRDPALLVGGRRIVARQVLDDPAFGRPLGRPRRFRVAARDLPVGPVTVTTIDGQVLLGSPVHPQAPSCSAGDGIPGIPAGPPAARLPRVPVDVVVPVHGNRAATLACLHALLPTVPTTGRIHVVDDAGPDPGLAAALDDMAAAGRITLHRLPAPRGFPGAANAGLRAAAGRDVVLLNSDTLVPPGWLAILSDAAYSAADIGTACPLSNEAAILSYPDRAGGNLMLPPDTMAALARQANGADTVDVPVANGFCMFIRHDCLAATGLLREDLFAQGYGEETEWCLRARQHGWRHVAAPGGFVSHQGGASFGAARRHLMARNAAVLARLHPGYDASVAAWIGRDPLGPARRRMDALRWQAGRRRSAVALVSHAGGGGVEQVVARRAAALRAAGLRPILLRPDGASTVLGDGDTPNLRFRLPDEWAALLSLLQGDGIERVELHHTLGHAPDLLSLAARLRVPQAVFIHDYATLCARINLVAKHSYCGEPPVSGCIACLAEHGSNLAEPVAPAALLRRSTALLAAAERVVVPSADTAARLRRHFPAIHPAVEPLEDDAAIPPPPAMRQPVRHLCVVGAIGVEKGYEVLLACVQDAAARRLPLRFTVVGFTVDDARLLAAGPVFVTGRFAPGEAEALIRRQQADMAFIPSIWPETWCFALGEAWRAGLRAIVFDLGAPAQRVRRTGWGHVLPLGLPPAAVNDWVLRRGNGLPSRVAPSPLSDNPVN